MQRFFVLLTATFMLVSIGGCYHAQIITGKQPSNKVIEKKWFMGFVYGLVMPDQLDVANDCPDGVAKVETQLSFLNQVVSAVTGGIITPMTLEVTCAAGPGTAQNVIRGDDTQQVLTEAAHRLAKDQHPVFVEVTRPE